MGLVKKTFYHYDPLSGAFTNISKLQFEEERIYRYRIPPVNSTEIPVPSYTINQIPVFKDGSWTVKADYRNKLVYAKDTGAMRVISEIGDAPTSGEIETSIPPELKDEIVTYNGGWVIDYSKKIEQLRLEKKAEVLNFLEETLQKRFWYQGKRFQCSKDDIDLIKGVIDNVTALGLPPEPFWRTYDNEWMPTGSTVEEQTAWFFEFAKASSIFYSTHWKNSRIIIDSINSKAAGAKNEATLLLLNEVNTTWDV